MLGAGNPVMINICSNKKKEVVSNSRKIDYSAVVVDAEKNKGFWEIEEAYYLLRSIGTIIENNAHLRHDWRVNGLDLWEIAVADFQTYTFAKVLREIYYAKHLIKHNDGNQIHIKVDYSDPGGFKSINYTKVFQRAVNFLCNKHQIIARSDKKNFFLSFFTFVKVRVIIFLRPFIKVLYNYFVSLWIRHKGSSPGQLAQKDIYFFNNLGRTTDSILPVIEELKIRGFNSIILQFTEDGLEKLKKSNTRFIRLEGLTNLSDIFGLLKWQIKVGIIVKRLLAHPEVIEKAKSLNVPVILVSKKELEIGMRKTLEGIYRTGEAFNRSGCFASKCIISTTERSCITRQLTFMANMKKIPFIVLQNGILPDHPKWLPKLICDLMAVEGQKVLDTLSMKGHETEKLVVTGQPKYDSIRKKYHVSECRDYVCRQYNFNSKKAIVLFASNQMNESTSNQSKVELGQNILRKLEFKEVYSLPFHISDLQVIIKPHPNEDLTVHEQLLRENPHSLLRVALKSEDTYSLIAAADLIIIHRSTVGLDSLIMDKPLLVFNLTGEDDLIPYVKYGAAVGVYEPTYLVANVKKLISKNNAIHHILKEGRSRFIKDYAFKIDGNACSRIADMIIGKMAK